MVDPDALRKAFGWFVLVMSSVILAQEIHPAVGITAAALTSVAAGDVPRLQPKWILSAAPPRGRSPGECRGMIAWEYPRGYHRCNA